MVNEAPAKPKGFFPKKGWRKVAGVWVAPAPPAQTPADRRNYANKRAGWPVH